MYLSQPILHQLALHGLLAKIRDLNLTLISVCRIDLGTSKREQVTLIDEVENEK
jgi:hypothetical protein